VLALKVTRLASTCICKRQPRSLSSGLCLSLESLRLSVRRLASRLVCASLKRPPCAAAPQGEETPHVCRPSHPPRRLSSLPML
jgi:hypothetical protein